MLSPGHPFRAARTARWLPTVAVTLLAILAQQTAYAQAVLIDGGETVTVPSTSQPSPWVVGEQLTIGFLGQGNLVIQNGGSVVSRTPGSTPAGSLGALLGSVGTATVTGVGSIWENLNGEFQVGQSGHGILLISDGGLVRMSTIFGTRIGTNALGLGEVTVTGAGSRMRMPGAMDVGLDGEGHLTISAGGSVNNDGGRIAYDPNSIGAAWVTGAGSTWNNGEPLVVGLGGVGSLTLADGGRAIAPSVTIAQNLGSSGVLAIGAAQGASPVAPGSLSTTGPVTFGAGTGRILFNHSDTSGAYTFAPLIAGAGQVAALNGTTVLSANNTYSGGTTLGGGVLRIASDANLGAASGALSFDAGTLSTTADLSTSRQATLGAGGGILETLPGTSLNYGGVISGNGALTKAGDGTLVLSGANTYAGGTRISAGTLQIGNDGVTGSIVGNLINDATLAFARTDAITFDGAISGSGTLQKLSGGTLILTGDSSYGGGTTIGGGTLQLGNGGTSGSIQGDMSNNGALVFNRSNGLNLTGAISGAGALSQVGTGTTTLSGNSAAFSGSTTVAQGGLLIDGVLGSAASTLSVSGGGLLGGTGTFGGSVTIGDGVLAPGDSPGTLTINGNLSLGSASLLNYEFGQVGVIGGSLNDLTQVGGNLTLDGTLNFSAPAEGAFDPGLYRLINYGGTLTDNGLALGTQPVGSVNAVQTAVAGQVNLLNTAGLALNFWDGGALPRHNGQIEGGSGVWQAAAGNDNWTDANAVVNGPYAAATYAVFAGTPGTVTVDNGLGAVVSGGMQFATSGYVVQGQPLTLAAGSNFLRVGDGSAPGAGYLATIAAELTGSGGINKIDLGTLVLTGSNSYTGGTTLFGGTLEIASDSNLGAAGGALTFNGGTLRTIGDLATARATTLAVRGGTLETQSGTLTHGGTLAGLGALVKSGVGTLVLNGVNSYSGGTTVNAGTLSISADSNLGGGPLSIGNATLLTTQSFATNRLVTLSGDAAFTQAAGTGFTLNGAIGGLGSLSQNGPGTLVLNGTNSYSGGTTLNAGTLSISADSNLGAPGGALSIGNGTLHTQQSFATDRLVTLSGDATFTQAAGTGFTLNGAIDGLGSLSQNGPGTLVLNGVNTYSGGTTVNDGTLSIDADASLGALGGGLSIGNGTLHTQQSFATNRLVSLSGDAAFTQAAGTGFTLNGAIDGLGSLSQNGPGTLVLNGTNSYSGGTTVNAGTLSISADSNLGSGPLSIGNGTLHTQQSFATNRSVSLSGDATFTQAAGTAFTLSGVIGGLGSLNQNGPGTLILNGVNSYSGGTTLGDGVLRIASDANLGAASGALSFDAGTLSTTADLSTSRQATLGAGGGIFETLPGTSLNYGGVISGNGALTKAGDGTLVLSGANTYAGGTRISAGTLQIGNDGVTGSIVGNLINDATLAFARTDASTFDGAISGSGTLQKLSGGTLILTGDSSYGGGTSIGSGTLQLGNGGTTGSILGDVSNNGIFVFNRSNDLNLTGAISGAGALSQLGTGTTTLSGNSAAFSGSTAVTQGALLIDGVLGSAASTLSVSAGGLLGGTGTFGGSVTIGDGVLAPGDSPGTLTINGNLSLGSASLLNYEFGQVGVIGGSLNDLTLVGGNLTLDGTLNFSASGVFDPGLYRLINYGGTLTDNGLALGTQPVGSVNAVQTAVAGQVNLLNTAGLALNFWDGGALPRHNGQIEGGPGVWQAAAGNDNWTDANGVVNGPYAAATYAVFAGTPGTVTVDNGLGAVVSGGMQFASSGYVVQGQPLTLAAGSNFLRVGDGSAPGAGYLATIAAELTGSGGINKIDLGTLVLTGSNSYTGGTTLFGGTLEIANDANLGAAGGALTFNGGTLRTTGDLATARATTLAVRGGTLETQSGTLTHGGTLAGPGALVKSGMGTLVLNGVNSYSGGTTLNAGTLSIDADASLGAPGGALSIGNATLLTTQSFATNRSVSLSGDAAFTQAAGTGFTLNGPIGGLGSLSQNGAGTLVLNGANSYSGGTTVTAGTLSIDADNSLGAPGGALSIGNATLLTTQSFATNRLVTLSGDAAFTQAAGTGFSLNGAIGGLGSLSQNGLGTLVLNGANSYSGGTTVNAGTLSIDADASLGALGGGLSIGNATLLTTQSFASNRLVSLSGDAGFTQAAGTSFTLNGAIGGLGSLSQNGPGTLVLNGTNSYSGGTTLNAGTLSISTDSNLGALGGALSIGNGTLHTQQSFATNRLVTLSGDAAFTQAAGTGFTLNGPIGGLGSLSQNGLGTLVLNGVNSYSGGTTLNAGTLSIDADASLGAPGGALSIGNATLLTTQSFATNRLVTLSGDAGFTQAAGTGFSLNGTIGGLGSLTLDGGAGGFAALNAGNTYTGATTLNSGSLFINGSIATSSQLTTQPATFLGGTGMLPQTTVGGFVSPGSTRDSSGTLSIAGDLTTAATASYQVDFNPGAAPDLIRVSGIAALNNADASTRLNDFIPVVNQPYAILTAEGGVNGSFNYPTRHLPLSDVSLSYDANNVYFLVTRNQVPIGGVPPGGGTPEPPIAITPPEGSTGGGVDELPPNNPILGAIVLLPTVGEIRDALNQLSGQIYPSQQTLLLESSHFARDAVNERLAAQLDEPFTNLLTSVSTMQLAPHLTAWVQLDPHSTGWGQGTGARRKQGDLVDDSAGTFFGVDLRVTETTTLGILGGYTRSEVDAPYSSSTGDNYSIGAYAGAQLGPWSLKAGTAYTASEIDTKRTISFGGFSDSPSEDYSANTVQVFGDAGYRFDVGPTVLEPYVDIAWVKVSAEGFTEGGGPAALTVDSNTHDVTFSTLGVRPSYTFAVRDMSMKLKGGLGWRHTFGDLEPSDRISFAPTGSFGMPGVPLAEDTTIVHLGLDAALTENTNLSLAYNGQFGSDAQENGFTGSLQIKF